MSTSAISPVFLSGAVTGADVLAFKDMFSLTTTQLLRVLSITRAQFNSYTSNLDDPVKDVALALTIRLYFRHPDLVESPGLFNVEEWYQSIGGQTRIKKRLLSILFGRDANSGYGWLDKGARLTPKMYNLLLLAAKKLKNGLHELHEEACAEATHRGVAPFVTGSWAVPANGRPCAVAFEDLMPTAENTKRGPKPKKKSLRSSAASAAKKAAGN